MHVMSDLSNKQQDKLGRDGVFKILFEALKDYQSKALSSGYKTLGFMVAALGWVMTSEETRKFLQSNQMIRHASVAFLILGCVAYALMSYRMYSLSRLVAQRLAVLDYASSDVYDHYRIKPTVPIVYTVLHSLISLVLVIAIRSGTI